MFLTTPRWWLPFFMPTTAALLLIIGGLLLIYRSRKHSDSLRWRIGACMNALGALVLYLACTPLIATLLAKNLERLVAPLRPEDAPKCDAIVVLGSLFRWYRDDADQPLVLSATADRLRVAVEAYKCAKAPWLVLGGGGKPDDGPICEGQFNKQQAIEMGVPSSAILVGGQVVNTEGEALQHAKTLRMLGAKKIILATSVFHLPRAAMQFRALGFEVVQLPCHYLTAGIEEQFSWRLFLPRGQALEQTETCLKEYLGLMSASLFPPKEIAEPAP